MENREVRCYFQYNGAYHYVPEDFVFPKGSCKNTWFRWHLGQESHGIGPFKKLKDRKFMTLDLKRGDQLLVNKADRVMTAIETYMSTEETEVGVNKDNCGEIFDKYYPELIKRLYGAEKFAKPSFRWMDLTYPTLANLLSAEKKRQRVEEE